MDYTNLFGVFYQFCSVFSTRFIRCFSGNLFGVFDIGWGDINYWMRRALSMMSGMFLRWIEMASF